MTRHDLKIINSDGPKHSANLIFLCSQLNFWQKMQINWRSLNFQDFRFLKVWMYAPRNTAINRINEKLSIYWCLFKISGWRFQHWWGFSKFDFAVHPRGVPLSYDFATIRDLNTLYTYISVSFFGDTIVYYCKHHKNLFGEYFNIGYSTNLI